MHKKRATRRFEKSYEKRMRRLRRLERETRECLRHQCGNKISHDNFLTAMQHASQLSRLRHKLYVVYCCETCGAAHVGHIQADSLVWMIEGYSEKISLKDIPY